MALRPMRPDDADAVAALHAASWRVAYRGIFTDRYLDDEVDAERRHAWRERLQVHPCPTDWGLVAEDDAGNMLGFAYVMPAHDPDWGHYLDNLHVAPESKGAGLGPRLMQAVAQRLPATPPRPLFLWVLDANETAKRFYARLGAEFADSRISDELAGERHLVWRCVWRQPTLQLQAHE
jgi:ribosomal protein S18 acetylase RimI-like enzyme